MIPPGLQGEKQDSFALRGAGEPDNSNLEAWHDGNQIPHRNVKDGFLRGVHTLAAGARGLQFFRFSGPSADHLFRWFGLCCLTVWMVRFFHF